MARVEQGGLEVQSWIRWKERSRRSSKRKGVRGVRHDRAFWKQLESAIRVQRGKRVRQKVYLRKNRT